MKLSFSQGETFLDPNHTHHLLVDDETVGKYGGEIDFRFKLESWLTSHGTLSSTPIVAIIIEGGPFSLKSVAKGLEQKIPCVILKGTGRAADVLSNAYQLLESFIAHGNSLEEFTVLHRETMIKCLKERLFLKDDAVEEVLNFLIDCLRHIEYLHVFEIGSGANQGDLKSTSLAEKIVNAFLKKAEMEQIRGKTEAETEESLWQNLCLSFQWDHVGATKRILEEAINKHIKFSQTKCTNLFVQAVKQKKLEFVDLFLDLMIDLKANTNSILQQLFELEPNGATLDEKLVHIIGHCWSTESRYMCDRANPHNYLFIYAIYIEDIGFARFLLNKIKYPIACALIACNILMRVISQQSLGEVDEGHQNHIKEFEDVAFNLLTECASTCPVRTRFLLVQEIASLGSMSVLQLAIQGSCLKFISHKVCQDVFEQMWHSGLCSSNSKFCLNLVTLLPPLAPLMLRFVAEGPDDLYRDDFKIRGEDASLSLKGRSLRDQLGELKSIGIDVGLRSQMSYADKMVAFLGSPRIKFGYSVLSYIVLLVLFSVLIIYESDYFERERPGHVEWLVFLFWLHFIMQELHQVVANGTSTSTTSLWHHLKSHLSDRWNFIDSIIILLIIVSLIFRVRIYWETNEGVTGLTIKMLYCFIYLLFWLRLLHIFMLTSFLGPKLVMIQTMLKDLVYISFCFLILGTSYSIVSYSLRASLAHECCGGNEVLNFTSSIVVFHEMFDMSWWNLFGEVGDSDEILDHPIREHPFFEFMKLILLPGMKGIYMLISVIILLNLLIAMFSYSFTLIQDQSYRIWCFSKHDLIFEYFDRSKIPAPFAILSLVKRFCLRSRCCKRWKQSNGFISTKRTFKIRLESLKSGHAWADSGKWAATFSKRLRRWEGIVANNFWLTHKHSESGA